MSEYNIQTGRIPISINLDELMNTIQGNATYKQYIRDGMVYFLSLLTVDNYFHQPNNDGYRIVNDKILSKIIGKGEKESRTSVIKNILLENGIIEKRKHRKGHYSTGFRLTSEYNTGVYIEVELSERIKKKLTQHQTDKNKSINIDITHLTNQFKKHEISVDMNGAEMFLKNLGVDVLRIINKSDKMKDENHQSLYNYIGRSMNVLRDINDKQFKFNFSENNHRFNSNITSLPKILRPFLKISDEPIGEVDLSSSQPFILSTILNKSFFENKNDGYNLETIYPNLKNDMIKLRQVIPSNQPDNKNYVLGVYLNDTNYRSLLSFIDFDFTNDFYDNVLTEGIRLFPKYINSKKGFENGRDYIKSNMMNFLFERNEIFRDSNPVVELLKKTNSGLSEYIERFNQHYTGSTFSILLQRTESYLILENVCKGIEKSFPNVPFFTIHDSIITTKSELNLIKSFTHYTIKNVTQKSAGLKLKYLDEVPEITIELIKEIFDKIHIKSQDEFDKKRYSFLTNNIETGIQLLC